MAHNYLFGLITFMSIVASCNVFKSKLTVFELTKISFNPSLSIVSLAVHFSSMSLVNMITKFAKNVNEITSISWNILRGAFVIIQDRDMEVYFENLKNNILVFISIF